MKYYQARSEIPFTAKIYSYPHCLYLLLEILLASIHPSPFLVNIYFENFNDATRLTTTYAINDILSLLMLVRMFFFLRLILTSSKYYGNSAKRIWFSQSLKFIFIII